MSFRGLVGWSQLGRVERANLYTKGWLHFGVWLVVGSILLASVPSANGGARTVSVVAGGVVLTALCSLMMAWTFRAYPRLSPLPWLRLIPLLVVGGVYFGAVGLTASGTDRVTVSLVAIVNLAAALGGSCDRQVIGAVLVASGALFGVSGGELITVVAGVAVGAATMYAVRASLWLNNIVVQLDSARHTQTQLALAEERLRFSHDVHDVLGRQLSAIAVSSELAATLAARGDDRAGQRMLDVCAIAHAALAEARQLARGYRATSLTQELNGACSLLRSAGVEVHCEVDVVPRGWHEAAAWVVRESVTNVLRHSTATWVQIGYTPGELRVDNNGIGTGDGVMDTVRGGSGLGGLRDRLEPLGASLDAGAHGPHWTVIALLPGAGPLAASHSIGAPRLGQQARS